MERPRIFSVCHCLELQETLLGTRVVCLYTLFTWLPGWPWGSSVLDAQHSPPLGDTAELVFHCFRDTLTLGRDI